MLSLKTPLLHSSMVDEFSSLSCCKFDSTTDRIEWTWDKNSVPHDDNSFVKVLNNDRDVLFHKKHSFGTAVVRSTEPMSQDQHFWEIAMISPVYGTDMMVGIGTSDADVSQLRNTFVSRLGKDKLTWGFSYTGSFYHDGEEHVISSPFDEGSIIGLHLDMWNGTLSFYKNRKHLGTACKGLNGRTLYAMASSTAACSSMRILRSCSFPSSLQFLCCVKLRNLIPDDKCVLDELDLPPGLKSYLRNYLSWFLEPRLNEKHPPKNQLNIIDSSLGAKNDFNKIRFAERTSYDPFLFPPVTSSISLNYQIVSTPRGVITLYNHNTSQRYQATAFVQVSSQVSDTTNQNGVLDEDLSDQDDIIENEVKRLKYSSYNYIMGLSDSDSDIEL